MAETSRVLIRKACFMISARNARQRVEWFSVFQSIASPRWPLLPPSLRRRRRNVSSLCFHVFRFTDLSNSGQLVGCEASSPCLLPRMDPSCTFDDSPSTIRDILNHSSSPIVMDNSQVVEADMIPGSRDPNHVQRPYARSRHQDPDTTRV